MDLKISKTVESDIATLVLAGWLDTDTAAQLGEALSEVGTDVRQLLLDFQAVEYISSTGIRMLIRAHKQMHAQGGKLTLLHVGPAVLDILQMSSLDKQLDIQ